MARYCVVFVNLRKRIDVAGEHVLNKPVFPIIDLRADGLLVDLHNVDGHSSGGVEFLAAMVTLEMLGPLMGDQDLLILEITLTVPRLETMGKREAE